MNIDDVLGRLTLEEKAALCSGEGPWATPPIDRLGVPRIRMNDGPHGLRAQKDEGIADLRASKPSTCFPTAACIAASWDVELAGRVGSAIADEARDLGCNLILGPGINIKRTPLCGRNFEYYAEDPVLAGEIAAAFVSGAQQRGVGATLKHYACNNSEFERMTIDVRVDERTLREIYLPAFERAIARSRPWAIMGAYNRVNGIFACEHPYLLQQILKDEWGFDGLVVSDWTAVNDRVAATAAGLDLEMPGPSETNDARVVEAVKSGDLSETVLDERVRRILTIADQAERSGIDTGNPLSQPTDEHIAAHHMLAREAAADSIILLKNSAEVLPLDPDTSERIALIGRFADTPRIQGGGSSKVNATRTESVREAFEQPGYRRVEYVPGYDESGEADAHHIDGAVRAAGDADAAVVVVGLPDAIESEGFDRENIDLPSGQGDLVRAVAAEQPNTVVVIVAGSVVRIEDWVDDVPAICFAGLGGQAAGAAIVDVIGGSVNPSGRLTETLPKRLEETSAWLNYPGENGEVRYGEGVFVGYRYHDAKGIEPRYRFGHGLSYTEFEYGAANVSSDSIADTDSLSVALPVTNVGERDGAEVVQLYVSPKQARLKRPPRELKAFRKVRLEAGERGDVVFVLSRRDFAYYDPVFSDWIVDDGEYELQIGSTPDDIRRCITVHVHASQSRRRELTGWNSIRDWLHDERGREAFDSVIGADLVDRLSGGMRAEREMFLNIPLRKVPQLTGGTVSEEAIDQLVKKVANGGQ